jgi:nucleoside-diphosphate-sugar epimerase
VTGSQGFIGSQLCRRLERAGLSILGLQSASSDVTLSATWDRLPKARVLYHLAGKTYVPESWESEHDYFRVNTQGTTEALRYCRKNKSQIVLASAYVYGIPNSVPISEATPINPNNPYAMSKYQAELQCRFFSTYYGVTGRILRVFNVYGPGQNKRFLIPSIISQVISCDRIEVRDLTPRRDYIYVDDVIDAFVLAGNPTETMSAFNIASGISYSVAQVVREIQISANKSLEVRTISQSRQQEILETRADVTKARKVLGWKAKTSFETGIRLTLDSEIYDKRSLHSH